MKTANVKKLKIQLVGKEFSGRDNGDIGRAIHDEYQTQGFTVNNGAGADLDLGACGKVEIKSRDVNATSPHSVGKVSTLELKTRTFENSSIHEKLQVQHRVKHDNGLVIGEKIYDFSHPLIQTLFDQAWNTAQYNICNNINCNDYYVAGTEYGYFERTALDTSWTFRIHDGAMRKLEKMASSTLSSLFDFETA